MADARRGPEPVPPVDPRRWLVLKIQAPSAELAEELAEGLIALGGTAVEETGRTLTTYLPAPADVEGTVRDALDHLDWIARGAELGLEWEIQEDHDWARRWREGLRPRRVGERIVVTPTWLEPETRPRDVVLRIDPEMAFGTGEHATTRGALRLLERAGPRGSRVLDVGTGSGILAIAAAKLGAASVAAVDSDGDAIATARSNVDRNGAGAVVSLAEGLVDDAFLAGRGAGAFDLIVANILSGVLVPLLPGFRRAVPAGGRLILAGVLEDEQPGVRRGAEAAGFILDREDEEQEWWSTLWRAV